MDLLLIGLASLLLIPLVYGFPAAPLRIVLGVPFVLFFPGYALLAVLFPRKGSLEGIERLALSLGLSLALVALVSLALGFILGLRITAIAVSLASMIFTLSGVALYRRRQISSEERYRVNIKPGVRPLLQAWSRAGRWERTLTVLLVLAVLATAGSLVYVIQKPQVEEALTTFYVLGPGGRAEAYPSRLWVGVSAELPVGIVNHEFKEERYRVEVYLAGDKVGETPDLVLSPEQKWEGTVAVVPQRTGKREKLELLLYKAPGSDPYRRLYLWVEVLSVG